MRRASGQAGQTAAEYLGLLLLAAVVVVVLAGSSVGERLGCETKAAIERVAGGDGAACGASDARRATARDTRPEVARAAGGDRREKRAKPLPPNWKPNGCSRVPDSGPYFDFESVCNGHDKCYAQQRGFHFCNDGFKKAMYRHCKTRSGAAGSFCRRTADTYYTGVEVGGKGAYDDAG